MYPNCSFELAHLSISRSLWPVDEGASRKILRAEGLMPKNIWYTWAVSFMYNALKGFPVKNTEPSLVGLMKPNSLIPFAPEPAGTFVDIWHSCIGSYMNSKYSLAITLNGT